MASKSLTVTECDTLQDFIKGAKDAPGRPRLWLLQHDEEMDDRVLGAVDAWSSADFERMSRFQDQAARTSWCLSRFLYRRVLSTAIGLEPGEIRLNYSEHGKPYIRDTSVRFNWAHARGCVALAVSVGVDVGCDVEDSARSRADYAAIMDSFFTADERRWVYQTGAETVCWDRFLCLFVQKEARLKTEGTGLSAPLKSAACTLREPPFCERNICCIRHGVAGRYIAAVSLRHRDDISTGAREREEPLPILIRAFRFRTHE